MDINGAEGSDIVGEVSSFQRLQDWYILGVGKGVLFREVSSFQRLSGIYLGWEHLLFGEVSSVQGC